MASVTLVTQMGGQSIIGMIRVKMLLRCAPKQVCDSKKSLVIYFCMQKGDGLQKINEQACLLLLGNLMMTLLKALNGAHQSLTRLQQDSSAADVNSSQDALHVFSDAVSATVYSLLGHNSEKPFWVHLFQAVSGRSNAGVPYCNNATHYCGEYLPACSFNGCITRFCRTS